jgi:TetR/AcrR family tetracycline transcriptional repressor
MQRPRGTTTRDAVVEAALRVVDDVGLEGLTIRAVAQRADAPPMSLYVHFSNKEELLDLMYTQVANLMYADRRQPTWQLELAALCDQIRALLSEHPRWIPLLSRPATTASLPLRERLLKLMVQEGMTPEAALAGVSSAVILSIGLVLAELTLKDPRGQSAIASRYAQIRSWVETTDGSDHPVTHAAMTKTSSLDLGANHELTVRALIAGLTRDAHH